MGKLTKSKTWAKLQEHHYNIKNMQIRDFFEFDDDRFQKYSINFGNLTFDYSKNRINFDTIALLTELANSMKLNYKIAEMFNGDKINFTENRAVLHAALRANQGDNFSVEGQPVTDLVISTRNKMQKFVNQIHSGELLGYTGKKITTFVNIGIGGSDLGPAMVASSLKKYAPKDHKAYFVSNVDSTDLIETLEEIDFGTTLFIIASKTFTTQETLRNANSAKSLFLDYTKDENAVSKHFVALSTNTVACQEFGINSENIFEFWDWVGGRFSLWSSIGLSIALYLGWENFEKLLAGAREADLHFKEAPFNKNIPVLMALLDLWYRNFFDSPARAVIPYEQYLAKFPAFLQQLEMESNGKYIETDGSKLDVNSSWVVFGEPGTNAQHSFFQLLHQGTQLIPVDFLVGRVSLNPLFNHHEILLSNCFAQSEALMKGKTLKEVTLEMQNAGFDADYIKRIAPHRTFQGNRPSTTIIYDKLTPEVLGSLIAFYEHKTFVLGVLWNINSFDQWGVELGKQLAKTILPEIESKTEISSHDCSTNSLINSIATRR